MNVGISFNTSNTANVLSSALAPKKTEYHKHNIMRRKRDTVNLYTLKIIMFVSESILFMHCFMVSYTNVCSSTFFVIHTYWLRCNFRHEPAWLTKKYTKGTKDKYYYKLFLIPT